ncbi:hypothetical protein HA402_002979 [Bradysia odoriphaga]|nr:hypothetical protein HA402_002979 [Bradysia odoriphaga]
MEQEKIMKILAAFFRNDTNRIQGALVIGSFGRGDQSPTSDIDIQLLLSPKIVHIHRDFINDLEKLFNDTGDESLTVKHTVWLADQRKLALYHGQKLLLTELFLYHELSQFDKYFLGSRISDWRKCILVDRHGVIHQYLERIVTLPYDDRDGLIESLVRNAQYYLESSSTARRRSDSYKFYFLSNIALHELVRLDYVLNGKLEYNYNPPKCAVDVNLTSTMDLDKSGMHLENLIRFFQKQLDRCEDAALAAKARAFCQDLLQRDSS